MKRKRIGIDARLLYQTGVGVYLRNLLFHLAKTQDETVTFVIFAKKSDWEKFCNEYEARISNFEFRVCNISWHSFAEQIIFLWQLIRADLTLVHFPYFSWPILYFRPFAATVHDTILLSHATGRASTLPFFYYKIKQLVFRVVFAMQVMRARQIFVPSNAVRGELIGFYPSVSNKVIVTHEGVDEVFAHIDAQKPDAFPYAKDSFFLYVGNSYPHKNVEMLIEAFQKFKYQNANVKTTDQNVKLILVGPKSTFAEKLKDKCKKLGEDILWMHDVDVAELKWLYANAKALVFPSKAEGFGLPIVEAASVGCPLILSDIPAFHEVAGEGACYFGVNDTDALAVELSKEKQKRPIVADDSTFFHLARQTFEAYQMT